ncbi:amidohydrolase family protein [Citreimonas sp.]|uniref:amidohydrolase family protein n=1 Tax=Citreimonas sp. TaxID=3036715 RepID=UPI0035C7B892
MNARVFPGHPVPPASFTDCFVLPEGVDEGRNAGARALWVAAPERPFTDGGGKSLRWIAPATQGDALPDAWSLDDDAAVPADHRPLLVAGRLTPLRIASLLKARPGPVVLRHLGAGAGDAAALVAVLQLAASDPRLWLETSGAVIGAFVTEAAARLPDRVIFASGAPVFEAHAQAAHVAAALSPDAARGVFVDNAARLMP